MFSSLLDAVLCGETNRNSNTCAGHCVYVCVCVFIVAACVLELFDSVCSFCSRSGFIFMCVYVLRERVWECQAVSSNQRPDGDVLLCS